MDATVPPRLAPLLAQYDWAAERLLARLTGPDMDSGDGERVRVDPLTDAEYLWEPAPGAWNVRRRTDGPGPGATVLAGSGAWGRDGGRPHPWPPPLTTIAWRMEHLSTMLAGRADHTVGTRSRVDDETEVPGDAASGIEALRTGLAAWREALTSADDAALDEVGRSTYPDGDDAEQPFLEIVWWVNQELLHHGAEIALLRDLHRALVASA
ncbi:DinB family protein [Actinotalea solisilvae]|uniref:DinB family protein n=1 Tax=Actinotalea solisilvae TaxID=2072922 RepID=UPI0018F21ADE|nr:DinB family protein [Actinotalea solisilvae]